MHEKDALDRELYIPFQSTQVKELLLRFAADDLRPCLFDCDLFVVFPLFKGI
jgi:hypothetical protein